MHAHNQFAQLLYTYRNKICNSLARMWNTVFHRKFNTPSYIILLIYKQKQSTALLQEIS